MHMRYLCVKRVNLLTLFSAIFFCLFSVSAVLAQGGKDGERKADDPQAKLHAKEILAKARNAISSKIDVSKIKTFYLAIDGVFNGGVELIEIYELNIALPDKINFFETIDYGTGKATTSQILNNNKSSVQQDSTSGNGAKSRSSFKKIDSPDDAWLKVIKLETSERLLPIVLDFPFINVSEFRYLGVAVSETGKADVIETVSANNETFRLLFDQKSYRLLMMVKIFTDEGKSFERNFFFSDYKENSGLMVPHKVTVKGVTSRGTELFIESNLRALKINPEIPAKTFDVKDK